MENFGGLKFWQIAADKANGHGEEILADLMVNFQYFQIVFIGKKLQIAPNFPNLSLQNFTVFDTCCHNVSPW